MSRWLPRPGLGPLGSHIGLVLKFVGELIELVEIDLGPEAERVGNDLRHRMLSLLRLFAETSTERRIKPSPLALAVVMRR